MWTFHSEQVNGIVMSWGRKQEVQASHTLQYFGTLGTGTIQGNTDFHHTDDYDGSLKPIMLLEREASKIL